MGAAAILDADHFDTMTGGDRALQAEVLGIFDEQSELWSRLLIPDAPVHTWRDAAHTLKGSARGLGLWELARACETAEALAKNGVKDGPVIAAELAKVRAALDEAKDVIRTLLASPAHPAV